MVKEIKLFNSEEMIKVDDEDFEYLNQWNWSVKYVFPYKRIFRSGSLNGKSYTLQIRRVIAERMGLDIRNRKVGHKDLDATNNTRSNIILIRKDKKHIAEELERKYGKFPNICFLELENERKHNVDTSRQWILL